MAEEQQNKTSGTPEENPVDKTMMTMVYDTDVPSDPPSVPTEKDTAVIPADTVIGRYTVVSCIGSGGMGKVYLARHNQLNSMWALKVLNTGVAGGTNVMEERFFREARLASAVRHPNVVGVTDIDWDSQLGVNYIVMEYVDGGSVRDLLRQKKKLSEEAVLYIAISVASALEAACKQNIVHRDIKPDNILINSLNEVKLTDLGIAKVKDELCGDNGNLTLTCSGFLMGTPAYLAPEQAQDVHTVDIRADIYSLGASMYEMLTGKTPYPGKTSLEIISALLSKPIPDPRKINPEISRGMSSLIRKMLEKSAAKRPQTPAELLNALYALVPVGVDLSTALSFDPAGTAPRTVHGTTQNGMLYKLLSARNLKTRQYIIFGASAAVIAAAGITAAVLFSGQETKLPGRITPVPAVKPAKQPEEKTQTPVQEENISAAEENTPAAVTMDRVEIHGLPIGAILELKAVTGGVIRQTVPASGAVIMELAHGRYMITLSHPDIFTSETPWDFSGGAPELAIRYKTGSIEFSISPECPVEIVEKFTGNRVFSGMSDRSGRLLIPELRKGHYDLEMGKDRYHTVRQSIEIIHNKKTKIELKLQEKNGILQLPMLAEGVEITCSGKKMYSGEQLSLRPGSYKLQVSAPGHFPAVVTVTITANRMTTPEIPALRQNRGVLIVNIDDTPELKLFLPLTDITLQVDEKDHIKVTRFPFKMNIPGGEHRIRLNIAGADEMLPVAVNVLPDKTAFIRFRPHLKFAAMAVTCNVKNWEFNIGSGWRKRQNVIYLPPLRKTKIFFRAPGYKVFEGNELIPYPAKKYTQNVKLIPRPRKTVKAIPFLKEYRAGMKLVGEKKYKEALPILLNAAKNGNIDAQYEVAVIYNEGYGMWFPDTEQAVHWYAQAAQNRHTRALYIMAQKMEKGEKYVKQDQKKALLYYHMAAEAEFSDAQNRLALIYERGECGTTIDTEKCLTHLRRAAENGHSDAQFRLGLCYERGQYLPSNINVACFWYQKAAANEHEQASERLEQLQKILHR